MFFLYFDQVKNQLKTFETYVRNISRRLCTLDCTGILAARVWRHIEHKVRRYDEGMDLVLQRIQNYRLLSKQVASWIEPLFTSYQNISTSNFYRKSHLLFNVLIILRNALGRHFKICFGALSQ